MTYDDLHLLESQHASHKTEIVLTDNIFILLLP